MLSSIIIWTMSALIGFGIGSTIVSVGLPRRPLTPGVAFAVAAIGVSEIAGLVYLAGQV